MSKLPEPCSKGVGSGTSTVELSGRGHDSVLSYLPRPGKPEVFFSLFSFLSILTGFVGAALLARPTSKGKGDDECLCEAIGSAAQSYGSGEPWCDRRHGKRVDKTRKDDGHSTNKVRQIHILVLASLCVVGVVLFFLSLSLEREVEYSFAAHGCHCNVAPLHQPYGSRFRAPLFFWFQARPFVRLSAFQSPNVAPFQLTPPAIRAKLS